LNFEFGKKAPFLGYWVTRGDGDSVALCMIHNEVMTFTRDGFVGICSSCLVEGQIDHVISIAKTMDDVKGLGDAVTEIAKIEKQLLTISNLTMKDYLQNPIVNLHIKSMAETLYNMRDKDWLKRDYEERMAIQNTIDSYKKDIQRHYTKDDVDELLERTKPDIDKLRKDGEEEMKRLSGCDMNG